MRERISIAISILQTYLTVNKILNLISYLYDQSRKTIHELSDLCKDNAWIKYFSEVYKSREQKGKDGGLTLKVKFP